VALAVGADGVHLGGGSVPADVARRLVGADALIGVSTHAPGEAPADADLAFFGPVYVTHRGGHSKGGAQGEARLAEAVRARPSPCSRRRRDGRAACRRYARRGAAGAAVIAPSSPARSRRCDARAARRLGLTPCRGGAPAAIAVGKETLMSCIFLRIVAVRSRPRCVAREPEG